MGTVTSQRITPNPESSNMDRKDKRPCTTKALHQEELSEEWKEDLENGFQGEEIPETDHLLQPAPDQEAFYLHELPEDVLKD